MVPVVGIFRPVSKVFDTPSGMINNGINKNNPSNLEKIPLNRKRNRGADGQCGNIVLKKVRKTDEHPPPGSTWAASAAAAVMPKQEVQFKNGCWVPPVVAVARFYGFLFLQDHKTNVSMASVRELRPGDEPEEFCEVFEEAFGMWPANKSFSNDSEFMESSGVVKCCGPTSVQEYGIWHVSKPWFDDLKKTVDGNNGVILLVERLERKDQGKTHYLLVLGYQETLKRRNGKSYTLYIKDPMEGNKLLLAKLWDEHGVELITKQPNGSTLDRYMILEATHLSVARTIGRVNGQTAACSSSTQV